MLLPIPPKIYAPRPRPARLALVVSGIYLVAGVLWILVSDAVLAGMTDDAAFLTRMQNLKGWFYVGCTALALFAGLRWALSGLEKEAHDRALAEQDLRRMQGRLERLVAERTAQLESKNRELEEFTYSVSHDLKAPLRGIDGYSQLLEEDYAEQLPTEGRRYIHTIRQATGQMNQLIDDLLTYSRLERRATRAQAADLALLVTQVLAGFESDPRRQRLELTLDVPALPLLTDEESLMTALRNLLDNALKFTRDQDPPRVIIQAAQDGEHCRLSVTDNGTGFDMKFHDRIFEIFQRLHRAEDFPGTGIGLALVRKSMERLGGRAHAESRPGEGATFHLTFPLTLP